MNKKGFIDDAFDFFFIVIALFFVGVLFSGLLLVIKLGSQEQAESITLDIQTDQQVLSYLQYPVGEKTMGLLVLEAIEGDTGPLEQAQEEFFPESYVGVFQKEDEIFHIGSSKGERRFILFTHNLQEYALVIIP